MQYNIIIKPHPQLIHFNTQLHVYLRCHLTLFPVAILGKKNHGELKSWNIEYGI